jgi:hypothetical protein
MREKAAVIIWKLAKACSVSAQLGGPVKYRVWKGEVLLLRDLKKNPVLPEAWLDKAKMKA